MVKPDTGPEYGLGRIITGLDPEFIEHVTGIKPIRKKSSAPCPKVTCIKTDHGPGCHNYDRHSQLGYTCLIKATSRGEPDRPISCCWYIAKGQTRLTMGELVK